MPANLLTTATTVKWNNTECTNENGMLTDNGLLKVNASATNSDMSLDLQGNWTITNGQTLVVLETSTNINTSSTHKVRNITLDGKLFDYTSNCDWSCMDYSVSDTATHKIIILSPIADVRRSNNESVFDHYADNDSMRLTRIGFNFRIKDTSVFKIYRVGIYNVAEIYKLYNPGTYPVRWAVGNDKVRFEFAGSVNKVDASGTTMQDISSKRASVIYKTLGKLSSNITNVNIRYLNITSGAPLIEDVFEGNECPSILCNTTFAQYFPTQKKDVKLLGSVYYQYKDGDLGQNYARDGDNSIYASYTRSFNEGYSTCVLPFEITTEMLENAGLCAYELSGCENNKLRFTKVDGNILANTPFVIKVEKSGLYVLSNQIGAKMTTIGERYVTQNLDNINFVGSYKKECPLVNDYNGHTCVGIRSNGTDLAYMTESTKCSYYRAFIDLGTTEMSRDFTLSFFDELGTTEIDASEILENGEMNDTYNLSGQRVSFNSKGIVIRNGRKFLNR